MAASGEGRDGLEAPFLVGDALEGLVAVGGQGLLPLAVALLPFGPQGGGAGGGAVDVGRGGGGDVVETVAIEEGAGGGQGEEEESHRGGCVREVEREKGGVVMRRE